MRRTCWWMAEHWPCWCMRESSMKDMLVAGQTTVRVFRRTCCWLAERRPVFSEGYVGGWRRGDDKNERIIDEGHVGGWPNNGQSFPKDMLLAGRTTASAFRRICWWLPKGRRQKADDRRGARPALPRVRLLEAMVSRESKGQLLPGALRNCAPGCHGCQECEDCWKQLVSQESKRQVILPGALRNRAPDCWA